MRLIKHIHTNQPAMTVRIVIIDNFEKGLWQRKIYQTKGMNEFRLFKALTEVTLLPKRVKNPVDKGPVKTHPQGVTTKTANDV